ncbi:MAG: NAD(P)-dependent oxidoreductase [Cyanobacteria bacterium SZAS-4]|nr:NAD(P)-dependent oxidoreductase [Cyanobacteria bacterium SZAS-4]
MSNQPQKIAYLGLGIMGSAMTLNFRKAGFDVVGWNRTLARPGVEAVKEQGISVVDSVESAVSQADVVFSCLGDVPDVEQVLLGDVKKFARKNTIVVDMTTVGKAAAIHLNDGLKEAGIRFLDAPVTGGDVGAKQGTLTILVGGEKATFDQVLPMFEAIGKNIVYCGPAGSGQAMKLCNQVLCAINMIAVSETFSLADQMQIDKKLLLESLGSGAGASWALSNLGTRVANGDFKPGFTLEHMLKDLRLIDENVSDCNLPGVELARQLFEQAGHLGGELGFRQGTQAMFKAYSSANQAV